MSMTTPEDEISANQKALLAHRKSLLELWVDQVKTYDKALLFLSSAGVGLSATILPQLANGPLATGLGLFSFSWVLFGLSLILQLIAYKASYFAIKGEIDRLDVAITNDNKFHTSSAKNTILESFNILSGVLFVFGAIFLFLFLQKNLSAEKTSSNEDYRTHTCMVYETGKDETMSGEKDNNTPQPGGTPIGETGNTPIGDTGKRIDDAATLPPPPPPTEPDSGPSTGNDSGSSDQGDSGTGCAD